MELQSTASAPDRLMMTLFLAGILHALVILGVSFSPASERKISKPLKIALVLPQEEEQKPEKADFHAEQDSVGSGESEEAVIPQTTGTLIAEAEPLPAPELPPTPLPAPPPPELIPETPPETLEAAPPPPPAEAAKPVLTQETSTAKIEQPVEEVAEEAVKQPRKEAVKPRLTAASLSQQIAQLGAELSHIKEVRAKRPVVKYINSVNAHKYKAAAYERAWQQKVERIGNLNYPDEARRRKLSGTLILAVGIKKDGSIASMKVRHSSRHKVLDDAAMQIVRLSSPFAPFPDGLKDEADILVITRTWKFFSDARLATD